MLKLARLGLTVPPMLLARLHSPRRIKRGVRCLLLCTEQRSASAQRTASIGGAADLWGRSGTGANDPTLRWASRSY